MVVYYLHENQGVLRDVVSHSKRKILEGDIQKLFETFYYFKTSEEMYALLEPFPGAYDNTFKIASQCQIDISTDQVMLPRFECPGSENIRRVFT